MHKTTSAQTRDDWDASDPRPRVLIEHEDPAWQWAAETALGSAGYATACCAGPELFAAGRCPLATSGTCLLATGADVVVHALSPHPASLEALRALRQQLPETPVVVSMAPPQATKHHDELAGCYVTSEPATAATLQACVATALRRA